MAGDGPARRTERITIGAAVTVRPAPATALPSATSQMFLQPELLSLRILLSLLTSQARAGDVPNMLSRKTHESVTSATHRSNTSKHRLPGAAVTDTPSHLVGLNDADRWPERAPSLPPRARLRFLTVIGLFVTACGSEATSDSKTPPARVGAANVISCNA